MAFQIEHLPQDEPATREEQWGFTIWEFITGNIWYLLGIVLLLVIFLFARSHYKKR